MGRSRDFFNFFFKPSIIVAGHIAAIIPFALAFLADSLCFVRQPTGQALAPVMLLPHSSTCVYLVATCVLRVWLAPWAVWSLSCHVQSATQNLLAALLTTTLRYTFQCSLTSNRLVKNVNQLRRWHRGCL
jgi:hypothetical protein